MNTQGQFFNIELGEEKKVPLFEGHCKASVSAKPKALDMWMQFAYADASQKFSLQKDLLYIYLYYVWTKPKHNSEKMLSYSMMVQVFSVVFSMV